MSKRREIVFFGGKTYIESTARGSHKGSRPHMFFRLSVYSFSISLSLSLPLLIIKVRIFPYSILQFIYICDGEWTTKFDRSMSKKCPPFPIAKVMFFILFKKKTYRMKYKVLNNINCYQNFSKISYLQL